MLDIRQIFYYFKYKDLLQYLFSLVIGYIFMTRNGGSHANSL